MSQKHFFVADTDGKCARCDKRPLDTVNKREHLGKGAGVNTHHLARRMPPTKAQLDDLASWKFLRRKNKEIQKRVEEFKRISLFEQIMFEREEQ